MAVTTLIWALWGALLASAPVADAPPAPPSRPAQAAGASAVDPPQSPPAGSSVADVEPNDGPVLVTTRLAPETIFIGDVLTYEVVAAYPRGVTVNLPSILDFSPLHQISTEATEPEATGEGLRKTFTIRLQHFALGEAQIPRFPLTYVNASGEVQTVDVPSRKFVVESLLANEPEPQPRPSDPPFSLEYPNTLVETIAYSALATLLAALIAWVMVSRWRRRDKPVYVPPPIPPHRLALEALRELEDGDLLAGERYQDYYLQLTEIAKGYLQGRFGVLALDRTTEEIRQDLQRNEAKIAPLSASDVIAFLQACDLVKFARFAPPAKEAKAALAEVRHMVRDVEEHKDEPEPRPEPSSEPASSVAEADKAATVRGNPSGFVQPPVASDSRDGKETQA